MKGHLLLDGKRIAPVAVDEDMAFCCPACGEPLPDGPTEPCMECPEPTDELWPCPEVWSDGGYMADHNAHEVAAFRLTSRIAPADWHPTEDAHTCPACQGTGWEPKEEDNGM